MFSDPSSARKDRASSKTERNGLVGKNNRNQGKTISMANLLNKTAKKIISAKVTSSVKFYFVNKNNGTTMKTYMPGS